MVHSYRLTIDSRQRTSGTPWDAYFRLQRTIGNPRDVRVVHNTFVNHLYNIRPGQNTLNVSIDGGATFTTETVMVPGFYTIDDFITSFNNWANTYTSHGFDFITRVGTSPLIEWDMHTGVVNFEIRDGPLRDVLGLTSSSVLSPATGDITSIFLAIPLNVSYFCPSLCSGHRHISTDTRSTRTTEMPLLLMAPVESGYGTNNVYIPPTQYRIECNLNSLDSLHFILVDSNDGQLMTDVQHWSLEIEITCDE